MPRWLWVSLPQRAVAVMVAAWLVLVLAQLENWFWLGALMRPITGHMVLVFALCALVLRRHRFRALPIIGMLLAALPSVLAFFEPRAAPAEESQLRVCTANCAYWSEDEVAEQCEVLLAIDCDILAVIELRAELAEQLEAGEDWATVDRRFCRRMGPYSMGVFSRVPLSLLPREYVAGPRRTLGSVADVTVSGRAPLARAIAVVEGQPWQILVAHPPPPCLPKLVQHRWAYCQRIADIVSASADPCILIGDLNTTPLCAPWQDLRAAGLRRAEGRSPRTWPNRCLYPTGLLGLSIDHIMVSAGLGISDLETLIIPGSDHRALVGSVGRSQ